MRIIHICFYFLSGRDQSPPTHPLKKYKKLHSMCIRYFYELFHAKLANNIIEIFAPKRAK